MEIFRTSNASVLGVAEKVDFFKDVTMNENRRMIFATSVPTYEVKTVMVSGNHQIEKTFVFLDMPSALEFMDACMHGSSLYYFPVEGLVAKKMNHDDKFLQLFKNGFELSQFTEGLRQSAKSSLHTLQQIGLDKENIHGLVDKCKKITLSCKEDAVSVANSIVKFTNTQEQALAVLNGMLQLEQVKLMQICSNDVYDAFQAKQKQQEKATKKLMQKLQSGISFSK